MPNKRFAETQEDGAVAQARRDNLKAHPMSPAEAARILCELHLMPDGRAIVGVIPDFTKVDGELYHEAWRVLRRFGGLDSKP